MGRAEFEAWMAFYRMQPFDDLHRFHRPAALISHSMGGSAVDELLEWLQPEPIPDGYSAADMATFKAFGVKPPQRG